MADEELIDALRKNAMWVTTHDAADRIEALVKERDAALASNRGLVRLNEATEARAEKAEAERDAANALLREAFDAGSDHGWDQAKQDECGGTEPLTPDEAFAAFLDAHLGAKP